MKHDDLDLLIQRYLDGCATDEDCMCFEMIMRDSHVARQRFWELAEVHALAGEAFLISQGIGLEKVENDTAGNDISATSHMPPLIENVIGAGERKSIGFAAWASFATVSCIVLMGPIAWRSAPSRERGERERLEGGSHEVLARIVESRSALRRDHDYFFSTGQVLGEERIVLAAGVLEIALMNGIRFVVEGPCDFELASNAQVILHRGQAVVHVPNGMKAFRFDTDNVCVVGASSEFAIEAESESSTVIQVYDGIAKIMGNANSTESPTEVLAGKAVRYISLRNAQPESIEFAPEKFIRRLSKDIPVENFDENSVSQFNQPVHEAIAVWKRRGLIEIDGILDDWPNAEGFHSVWEKNRDGREYVTGHMMYDDEKLYISAHVGDPFPMMNLTTPDTDADLAWRGGGLQVRIWAERYIEWPADLNSPEYYLMRSMPVESAHQQKAKNQRVAHLNLWYHAPKKLSCLHVTYGMEFKHVNDRINPPNFEGMFRRDDDGRGYVVEYAIPWELLNASGDPPQSGDRIPLTWTTHWSDEGGRMWRGQLNELRNANEPARLSSWERAATWGRAEFE